MSENAGSIQPAESESTTSTPKIVETAGKEGKEPPAYTTDTKVGSAQELKERAPDVYNAMLKGIAQSIVGRMRRHAEKLKKMMREGRRNG